MISFLNKDGKKLGQGELLDELSQVGADGIRRLKIKSDIRVNLGSQLYESNSVTVKSSPLFGKTSFDIYLISTEDKEAGLAKYLLAAELYLASLMEAGDLAIGYDKNLRVKSYTYKGHDRAGNQIFKDLPHEKRPKIAASIEMALSIVEKSVGLCPVGLAMKPKEVLASPAGGEERAGKKESKKEKTEPSPLKTATKEVEYKNHTHTPVKNLELLPSAKEALEDKLFQCAYQPAKGLSLDGAITALNELHGLQSVKDKVKQLINSRKIMALRGDKTAGFGNHLVFYGPPGVGKTTVARLIGEIYRELGILKTGHVIEGASSGFIAVYLGQTPSVVETAFKAAVGGVLFIDEIDTIGEVRDYGREAIGAINKLAEDYRDRVVVIAAGYKDKVESFFSRDVGLRSRFDEVIEFPSYSASECLLILESIIRSSVPKIEFEDGIREILIKVIESKMVQAGDRFGNARDMRSLAKIILNNQRNRLADKFDEKELYTIRGIDVTG